ncbi:MAG TPA: DAK2 domain-containing protein [Anaerolineales bacterium]|nr:DAK2 domain-containing protein [Anaerolineales bacterium]
MTKTPSQRPKRGADLSALFNVAAQVLAANQSSLNQADSENQNHGDNMVQTFNMITQSMASQRGSAPSTQLQHASEYLAQNAQSGSGQIYSQGLAQAAQQFQGQKAVTPDNAMVLIQSLLGGGQQSSPLPGSDLAGSLMGGQQGQSDGVNIGDLLNAGMNFMNAKQQGQDNMQAAMTALMSAGPMAQKPHRQQSGQLVANALLQAISGMSRRR